MLKPRPEVADGVRLHPRHRPFDGSALLTLPTDSGHSDAEEPDIQRRTMGGVRLPNRLVGSLHQRGRERQPQRRSGLQIDDQLELAWLLDR